MIAKTVKNVNDTVCNSVQTLITLFAQIQKEGMQATRIYKFENAKVNRWHIFKQISSYEKNLLTGYK